jgi:riboflavin biosynthesis pyrimidine reductase
MYASHLLWNDLLAHGLIDELHFIVGNVVLGGTPAFVEPITRDDSTRSLQVIDARKLDGSNNLLVRYRVGSQQA